jgi:uncharacterized protein (DUF2237 family)
MSNAGDNSTDSGDSNVYGDPLQPCSRDPETGFLRDGHCRHLRRDPGRHEVCAVLTAEFLEYSKAQGNDLVTPRPEYNFPGLEPDDCWCLCVPRWVEAHEAGCAPPVVLEATSEAVLEDVPLSTLEAYAVEE